MRRVSSRQRLVSWDAFDATARDDDDASTDSDYVTCYDEPSSVRRSSSFLRAENGLLSAASSFSDYVTSEGHSDDLMTPLIAKENSVCSIPCSPSSDEMQKSPSAVVCRKRERRSSSGSNGMRKSVSFSRLAGEADVPPVLVPADPSELPVVESKQKTSDASVDARNASDPTDILTPPSYSVVKWENSTVNLITLLEGEQYMYIPGEGEPSSCIAPAQGPFRQKETQLNDVVDDAKLHVLSFLAAADIRSVSATCQELRHLIVSDDANYLWVHFCREQWPLLGAIHHEQLSFRDDYDIPTAANNQGETSCSSANLSVLVAMSAKSHPLEVKWPTVSLRRSARLANRRRIAQTLREPEFRTFEMMSTRPAFSFATNKVCLEPEPVKVVQFKGAVGAGDRCIRSDHPFPRVRPSQHSCGRKWQLSSSPTTSLYEFLCRGVRGSHNRSKLRPFVSPFVSNGPDGKSKQINLTPRLVAYFEITILPRDESQEPEMLNDSNGPLVTSGNRVASSSSDCVAIGLSASSFHLHSKMPGWDSLSFGYHGDDGGIFHASGDMIRKFGPSYGEGDTIGCGVDYVSRGIFFTLNGKFLGYGWTDLDDVLIMNDLYPTVGVDTNCPIACNFGERPFGFDLKAFTDQHKDIIECTLSPLKRVAECPAPVEQGENGGSGVKNRNKPRASVPSSIRMRARLRRPHIFPVN